MISTGCYSDCYYSTGYGYGQGSYATAPPTGYTGQTGYGQSTYKLNQAIANNNKLMVMIQQVGNLVIITVCNSNYLGSAYGKDSSSTGKLQCILTSQQFMVWIWYGWHRIC